MVRSRLVYVITAVIVDYSLPAAVMSLLRQQHLHMRRTSWRAFALPTECDINMSAASVIDKTVPIMLSDSDV
jgi:hypothetical protein